MLKKIILSLSLVTVSTNIFAMEPAQTTAIVPTTQQTAVLDSQKVGVLAKQVASNAATIARNALNQTCKQICDDPKTKELVASGKQIYTNVANNAQTYFEELKKLTQKYFNSFNIQVRYTNNATEPKAVVAVADIENDSTEAIKLVQEITNAALNSVDTTLNETLTLIQQLNQHPDWAFIDHNRILNFNTYVKRIKKVVASKIDRLTEFLNHSAPITKDAIEELLMDELSKQINTLITDYSNNHAFGADTYKSFADALKKIIHEADNDAKTIISESSKDTDLSEDKEPTKTEITAIVPTTKPASVKFEEVD